MKRRPRTPSYWPRMKIRGKRRRRLAAIRRELLMFFPSGHVMNWGPYAGGVDVTLGLDGGQPPADGASPSFAISIRSVRDGFGRSVKATPRPKPAEPKPKREVVGGTLFVAPAGSPPPSSDLVGWSPLGYTADSLHDDALDRRLGADMPLDPYGRHIISRFITAVEESRR